MRDRLQGWQTDLIFCWKIYITIRDIKFKSLLFYALVNLFTINLVCFWDEEVYPKIYPINEIIVYFYFSYTKNDFLNNFFS